MAFRLSTDSHREKHKYFWSFDDVKLLDKHHNVLGVVDKGIRLSSQSNSSTPWLDLGSVASSCITKPYECSEGFTILFWTKLKGDQNDKILLNVAELENARGVHVRISRGRLRFSTTGLEMYEDVVPRTVRRYLDARWDFEYWTLVGLVWKQRGKEMKIVYNCSEADYTTAGIVFDRSAHAFDAASSFIVGASGQLLDNAEAEIDELGIWDVVYQQQDICQVYQSRKGKKRKN